MRLSKLLTAGLMVVLTWLATIVHCQASSTRQVPLPEQEIRAVVERFLAEKLEGRGWETSIRRLAVPSGIKVSSGVRDLELIAPAGWDGWGATSVVLVVRVNGVVEKNLSLRLLIDAQTEMVTASRQLLAGTVLTEADLQLQKQDLAQAGGLPVKNITDAVGKKLRITVRAGTPIRSNQLVSVPVVVSGQLVTIIAENAGVRITVSGRARSAGGVGELIRVQNLVSNKEIPARVVDASTVEVGF
ncbi:flagellar basal body P-ring formation chaperone FlgA [Trichlorobacter lovleyi]|uniref:Flagella basal body P-ring formation protein FlgA n=2 Tax=Trichlorobacter lovleyi TaxID=313985 RepID=B3EAV3_TRIL1|nr:flagellar basal body P-ring formation chaperone FlgA [Trichlorobacter lovleyi]ACD96986.1 flagella basal body P-ring formation protein FlgA [Trichlorobacter lovleyi SZ]